VTAKLPVTRVTKLADDVAGQRYQDADVYRMSCLSDEGGSYTFYNTNLSHWTIHGEEFPDKVDCSGGDLFVMHGCLRGLGGNAHSCSPQQTTVKKRDHEKQEMLESVRTASSFYSSSSSSETRHLPCKKM